MSIYSLFRLLEIWSVFRHLFSLWNALLETFDRVSRFPFVLQKLLLPRKYVHAFATNFIIHSIVLILSFLYNGKNYDV